MDPLLYPEAQVLDTRVLLQAGDVIWERRLRSFYVVSDAIDYETALFIGKSDYIFANLLDLILAVLLLGKSALKFDIQVFGSKLPFSQERFDVGVIEFSKVLLFVYKPVEIHAGTSAVYAPTASAPPSGKKYCVPLIGSVTLRSSSCKSSLRSTKSMSEVLTISRSDDV